MNSIREEAKFARDETLRAIRILHDLILRSRNWENPFQDDISKGIGISIGVADTRILCKIYEYFPELNDLNDNDNLPD
jgi:hypothetical protein